MGLKIAEILKITGGKTLWSKNKNFSIDAEISGISTDSRKLKRRELFVALKGGKFDGNNFIPDAFKKGAIAALVPKQSPQSPKSPYTSSFRSHRTAIPARQDLAGGRNPQFIIQVPDTLQALGDIAKYYRKKFKIPLIAVTGSCGKTTTKEITASILSSQFKVLKSPNSYNNLIGLPLTIFNITGKTDMIIVEMGMSHPGEIKRLAEIARPDIAVITNVGKAHIGFFNSLKDVAEAKAELFQAPVKPKISILNRDDKFFPYFISEADGRAITFGINKQSDFRAEKISFDSLGRASFSLNGKKKIKLPFIGKGNIYNVLASISIAYCMGIKIENVILSLSQAKLPSQRTALYKFDGIRILDDTYNANPLSFVNLLETVERIKVRGKKILVFGDMLELGEKEREEHIKAGRLISDSSIDVLITVGNNTKFTSETISAGRKAWHFDNNNRHNAREKLESLLGKGDLLILKGSRAMEMEEIIPTGLKD